MPALYVIVSCPNLWTTLPQGHCAQYQSWLPGWRPCSNQTSENKQASPGLPRLAWEGSNLGSLSSLVRFLISSQSPIWALSLLPSCYSHHLEFSCPSLCVELSDSQLTATGWHPAAVIFIVQLSPPDGILSWKPSAVLSLSSLSSHLFIAFGIACNFPGQVFTVSLRYKWHEGRNLVCFHIKPCLIHRKYLKILWTNGGINYY